MHGIKIIKQLGYGGTCSAYLAYDCRLERNITLKCLRQDAGRSAEEGLKNEAEMLALINGKGAPRLLGSGNGYIKTEYVSGESLLKRLKDRGRLPEKEAVGYARDIIKALRLLHERKVPIVYRDLKPANIIVGMDGHARLIDFGAARLYRKKEQCDTDNLGTAGYAAPEQYGSLGQTSPQTDIYCFGMTLLQLVTGADIKDSAVINEIKACGARGISPELLELIERCIKPERKARFLSSAEAERALLSIPRRQRHRRTVILLKAAMFSLLLSAAVTLCFAYQKQIMDMVSHLAAELALRLPAVCERLEYARERIGEFLTYFFSSKGEVDK